MKGFVCIRQSAYELMKKLLSPFVIALCVTTSFAGPSEEPEIRTKAVETVGLDPALMAPIVGGGVKGNGELTEGNLFFFYPWNNTIGKDGTMEGSLFFLEPYGLWVENGEVGASLGFGYRRLFSNQSVSEGMTNTNPGLFGEGVYVGVNAFLDYEVSTRDHNHWQTGFGLELGTRYIEVRGNYYLPISDHEVAKTPSGFLSIEEALEGWDVELAVLVPVIDKYMDVQLIGGYYGYSGGDIFNADFEGWKAGVEARPVPNLVLSAIWFETEHLYGDNWLTSISVELPWGELRDMIGSVFKPRRRHLAERMFKIVHRNNSAITYDTYGEVNDRGPASGGQSYCPDVGRACKTPTGSF